MPRKNLLDFFGHPMLAYSIDAAINAQMFDRVIVSTEDAQIADVARLYGAEVLDRPPHLAEGDKGIEDVALHALDALGSEASEVLCHLLPTCPLRTSKDVIEQGQRFLDEDRECQISVFPIRAGHPQWSLEVDESGVGSWFYGESWEGSDRFPPLYCPTGAVWWTKASALKKYGTFYGEPFYTYVMDANRAIDIDTQEDVDLAELLVLGLERKLGRSPLEPIARLG